MGLQIVFWQFTKPPNSTKVRPESGQRLELNCVLKEGSSIVKPSLLLDMETNNPAQWTYAAIPSFGNRYYFVRDWVNVQGALWECYLECDVMATYRLAILQSTQFIERAESEYNTTIPDSLAAVTREVTTRRIFANSPWRSGTIDYVVEILGSGTSVFYEFTSGQLIRFFASLFSDDYADSIMPGWVDLYPQLKADLNPLQYIGSIRAYPVGLPISGSTSPVYVGWGEADATAGIIPTGAIAQSSYTLNAQYPAFAQGSFISGPPYSEYELYFPPFGLIPLDAGVVGTTPEVEAQLRIDLSSGSGILNVYGGDNKIFLGQAQAQIGVNIHVGQVYNDGFGAMNAVSSAVGVATKALTGDIVGAVNNTAATIENFIGSLTPKLRATGGGGAWAGFSGEIALCTRTNITLLPNLSRVGRPLYATRKISDLSGFIMCSNAYVESTALPQETEMIEQYMNGGFIYE